MDNIIEIIMKITRHYDEMFDLNAMRNHAVKRETALRKNRTGESLGDDKGFVMEYSTMNHYLIEMAESKKLSGEAAQEAAWEYNGETNIYPFYLWHVDKVTYRFDREIEDLLCAQAQAFTEDTGIPMKVLEYLPHRIFFVATTTSPLTEQDRKYLTKRHKNKHLSRRSKQVGFFFRYGKVFIVKDGVVSEDTERKSMEFFVLSQRDGSGETNVMPVSVMVKDSDTVKDIIDRAVNDYYLYGDETPNSMEYSAEYNLVMSVLRWALQYVLYLCSENAEIEQDQTNRQMYRHPTPGFVKNKPREVFLLDAGKKTGAMIHAFKEKKSGERPVPNGVSAARSPHVRRAHWHHYWTGSLNRPEERRLVLKWVAPSYIHKEQWEMLRPSVAEVRKKSITHV